MIFSAELKIKAAKHVSPNILKKQKKEQAHRLK